MNAEFEFEFAGPRRSGIAARRNPAPTAWSGAAKGRGGVTSYRGIEMGLFLRILTGILFVSLFAGVLLTIVLLKMGASDGSLWW